MEELVAVEEILKEIQADHTITPQDNGELYKVRVAISKILMRWGGKSE